MHLYYAEKPERPATMASNAAIAAILPLSPADPDSRAPWAHRWMGNLLELTPGMIEQIAHRRLIVNSGTLAVDLNTLDPHNWMADGMKALTEHLELLGPALRAASTTLLVEPCSRHILHDAPVVRDFFSEHSQRPIGLALNPTALFEPSMLQFREDHLRRIADTLAPLATALILTDARLDAAGGRLAPCHLGDGAFDPQSTAGVCLAVLAPDIPIVLRQSGATSVSVSLVEFIEAHAASRAAV